MFSRILSRLPSREVLRNVLHEHPLIDGLFAQVLYEPWFRVLLASAALVLPAIPLLLFPLIKTSPDGFTPRVRVSGIDLVQAWSLKRTAVRQASSGDTNGALFTWRMAIANNPADPLLLREFLQTLSQTERPQSYIDLALPYSRWLLRLSKTNQSDVEMVAKMYEKIGLHDLVVETVAASFDPAHAEFALSYLKALFHRGDYERFAAVWKRCRFSGQTRALAELYYAGCVAVAEGRRTTAKPEESSANAKRHVREAEDQAELQVDAHRIQLQVTRSELDREGYLRSLQRLARSGDDTFLDHLNFWNLLLRLGQTNEARSSCEKFGRSPQEPDEAVKLASFHYNAGQPEEALRVFAQSQPKFPQSEPVWISQCNLLLELKRWDELRMAAIQARAEMQARSQHSTAYAWYFEAVANLHSKREDQAERMLRSLKDRAGSLPQRMEFAERILAIGYPEIARDILRESRGELGKVLAMDREYWMLLARAASEVRDLSLLTIALSRAHEIQPTDPVISNNLAAALLASRGAPARALKLTTDLMRSDRIWVGAQLNYSLALVQNGRVDEAERLLASIPTDQLTGPERSTHSLAKFEIAALRENWNDANSFAPLINRDDLLGPERENFDEKCRVVNEFLRKSP
jgi:tetratricopeptide (TPR) repeat protein